MQNKTITVPFEVKAIQDDGDFFTFEGYAAAFDNVDRGGDRIIKGAFLDTIKDLKKRAVNILGTNHSKLMPILWMHDHGNPVGSFIEMKEDDRGLFVKGIMPKEDDLVRGRVIPQMKAGSVSDMSIGYAIKSRDIIEENGMDVWELKELELFETSLVTIPMNTEANITAFKSVEFKDMGVAEKTAAIRKDYEDGDTYLCGMPIAEIVKEKTVLIPSAIFAVTAAVQCGRVKHDQDDIDVIKGLYNKMGLDDPFSKSYLIGENEAKTLTLRQIEKFLFTSKSFSKEAATIIVNKLKAAERDAGSEQSVRDAAQKSELLKALNDINNLIKGK